MSDKKTRLTPLVLPTVGVGEKVTVHYLESPNALRAKAVGTVLAVRDEGLTVKLTRPDKKGELTLERVPPVDTSTPDGGSLPRWAPAPLPAG